jgi:hypothetical protein
MAYSCLLYDQPTLTGMNQVDGSVGVLLGLYICSHPAAHLVNLLFFGGRTQHPFLSGRSSILWVALDMLVFLIGWVAIFVGTTRLIGGAD